VKQKPEIIYEDKSLLILNKPSGWIVNYASTTGNTPVVQKWLEKLEYPLAKKTEFRSGIVHRLDKETSGLMIVAKTKTAFRKLQKQFKDREVNKTYLALLHGMLEPKKGNVDAPVGRLPWNRERFGVLPGGRKAVTDYKVVTYYKKDKHFSMVEFYPKTGRTHQIRIHAKYLHHPIVSDEFYAGRKTARDDRKWCPRLFLHASKIAFNHPEKDKRVEYESKLSDDLQTALDRLEKLPETT
jgi:23S rRNA pseudouridine1911/1915/1917 synthase